MQSGLHLRPNKMVMIDVNDRLASGTGRFYVRPSSTASMKKQISRGVFKHSNVLIPIRFEQIPTARRTDERGVGNGRRTTGRRLGRVGI